MRWQQKARIQNVCSRLPAGNAVYFLLQRRFGSLRQAHDPRGLLKECAGLVSRLTAAGRAVADASVMEVGTGRRIDIPLGYYLAGAARVVTVDLNRYLRPELVMASIRAMRGHAEEILGLYRSVSPHQELESRFHRLVSCESFDEVLRTTNISYLAPTDAQRVSMASGSIDIQTSYTVFEHIPREVLVGILKEASRLLDKRGVALHHIDLSDHYAHDDPSISFINFLQFSQQDWARLAGNRFAYHNRLRVADYRQLYAEAGHEILAWEAFQDQRSLELLKNGFPVDPTYQKTNPQELATSVVRVLSR